MAYSFVIPKESKDLNVIIPTYNRSSIVCDTVSALDQHLIYDVGYIHVYVGMDGNDDTMDKLMRIKFRHIFLHCYPGPRSIGKRVGLGGNLNMLLNIARKQTDGLYFQMDDDHMLIDDLDLTPHAKKLYEDPTAGWIRLMGVAGHKYSAMLDGSYWKVDWHSPEVYITSNRPHLKHNRFLDVYGSYPEGRKIGATEEEYCHKCIDIAKKALEKGTVTPYVLIPVQAPEDKWDHIGESWQKQGE